MVTVAVVQYAPVLLDKEKTLARAVALVQQAADKGAKLLLFPEAFISGYPAWIWRLRPGSDWGLCEQLHQRLLDSAIDLTRDELKPLQQAAKTAQVTVVCGLNERDASHGAGTLYNSVVTIGPNGTLLNHHRKLMPTNPERMTWGMGDASGLTVVETPAGRVGSLICWENYMPLARYALYAQGIELYLVPTYDSGEAWLGTLQHIAREGRCWVLGCGVALRYQDLPDDFPDKAQLYNEQEPWINPGDSVVISPGGEIVAGPLHQQQDILYCQLDVALVAGARRALDVAGHYARADIFTLHVNNKRPQAVEFD